MRATRLAMDDAKPMDNLSGKDPDTMLHDILP